MKALSAALVRVPGLTGIGAADLKPLPTKGIAHDHVRIGASGYIARVPRPVQFAADAGPDAYIRYQAASFARAAPSGHVPRLVAAIAPSAGLPRGALVIEEIVGRPPRLPEELALIAECLARIHSLPVPPPAERPPLIDHEDPARGTLDVIERNARSLDAAGVAGTARRAIEEEIAWARRFAADAKGKDQPVTLVVSDSHPGNYLVDAPPNRPTRRAMFVDIEKTIYGSPAVDLAHATVYTSTTWDVDCGSVLKPDVVAGFYRDYRARIDADLARRLKPWLAPMRRLTWLRTTTWACRFKAELLDRGEAGDPASAYVRHVQARIADFLNPATIASIRREWLEGRIAL